MRLRNIVLWLLVAAALPPVAHAQHDGAVRIAAVRYAGGGDWYQAQTPLPSFLAFVRENTLIDIAPDADVVELASENLFTYPFIVMSGHGNISLTGREVEFLRTYLERGGFLYVDDDYGLDPYFRRELARVFPDHDLTELPFSHPIFRQQFDFPGGLPKIHEHDDDPPQGFGLFLDDRLAIFYTYETNLTDGWEPAEVHGNPEDVRRRALEMGTNILQYALTH